MLVLALVLTPDAAAATSEQEYEDEIVNPIRMHWLHRKADFTVVEKLIPDFTTLMFKEVGHGEEDRVMWNFTPIHTAWTDHMVQYDKMTEEEIEAQLQRNSFKSDDGATSAAARLVCTCTLKPGMFPELVSCSLDRSR